MEKDYIEWTAEEMLEWINDLDRKVRMQQYDTIYHKTAVENFNYGIEQLHRWEDHHKRIIY